MSTIQVEHLAFSLSHLTEFTLLLPDKLPPAMAAQNPCYNRPPITLVLLHGYIGTKTDWLHHTPIANLARKYNLAVVMPIGDISFYLDGEATGRHYATYIGEELPRFLRETFGIAMTPETTMIGGNSMGGFGAIRSCLAYPGVYGGAFGLSTAMIIHDVARMTPETKDEILMANYEYYRSTFGDPAALEQSEKNPEVLVKKLKADGKALPPIFMACGTEDFLIRQNREFKSFLEKENGPLHYEEGSGIHDWEYWNTKVEPAIAWLLERMTDQNR